MGSTHVRLAKATKSLLEAALQMAWMLRVEKNAKTRRKKQ
jgi:hypothetical protein